MTILNFILYVLVCLLVHELGHVLAARVVGIEVKQLGLWWLGPYNVRERSTGWREAAVCLAGPAANVLLALLLLLHGQQLLAIFNLEVAAFNLLPIPHSDGRHAWEALALEGKCT